MKYKFDSATLKDAKVIADIETEHFEDGIAYTEEFIRNWMNYNPNMFYVVRDENGGVVAHIILVPVTDLCYDRLRLNEIHDMSEFTIADVLPENNSDFYYTASIAIRKELNKSFGISVALMNGIATFFNEHGKCVITTPITPEGLKITMNMGYKSINGIDNCKENFELDLVALRNTNRFQKILTRGRKNWNKREV